MKISAWLLGSISKSAAGSIKISSKHVISEIVNVLFVIM
jgi:hypothetical protein